MLVSSYNTHLLVSNTVEIRVVLDSIDQVVILISPLSGYFPAIWQHFFHTYYILGVAEVRVMK